MINVENNIKTKLIQLAEQLPEDCSYDDVFYKLYVIQKFEAGLKSMKSGDVYTEEQIMQEHRLWLE